MSILRSIVPPSHPKHDSRVRMDVETGCPDDDSIDIDDRLVEEALWLLTPHIPACSVLSEIDLRPNSEHH